MLLNRTESVTSRLWQPFSRWTPSDFCLQYSCSCPELTRDGGDLWNHGISPDHCVLPLNLGPKTHCGFSLALSWIICPQTAQLPYCMDTPAALGRNPYGNWNLRLVASKYLSVMCVSCLEIRFSSLSQAFRGQQPGWHPAATSRETWSHPVKASPNP